MSLRFFLRTTKASARVSTLIYWRFFSWTGFALRFLSPMLNLGVAWILYNVIFSQSTSSAFVDATNSTDYFSFVVVGSAFYVYVVTTMFSLGRVMFWDRAQGILEVVFLTPISSLSYMAGRMVSAFSMATLDLLVLFTVGYFLGFRTSSFNLIVFSVAIILMLVSLFGLGLIVNAITLIFRDRVNTANTLTTLILVFSGIVAPLKLMPFWAQAVGTTIPFTHALNLMRSSLLSRTDVAILGDLGYLLLLAPIYSTIGYVLLFATVRAVRSHALYSSI